ncbi:MAG TPA: NAD(P)-dependent oxidoreductase [Streptosporangiaceae bacterium]|jgi:phosphoglycerate dehydrogenase-like enzyme
MRVLFCREWFTRELAWDALAPLLPGWELACCPMDQVIAHLDGADVVCPFGAAVGRDVLEAGEFGLVHQFGVGVERIDVASATELGVWVARVPGEESGNADSVAELAVLHLLALVKRLDEARAALAEGRWMERPAGGTLRGMRVVIVGLGAIGTSVAHRLAAFGAVLDGVRAHPELAGPAAVGQVVAPGELCSVLATADAVICCAMYDGSNRGMFGPAEFAAMKPGTVFVNVARGGLVDESALLAALTAGHLRGAGLDVQASEPADPAAPLLRHPRVIATPHVAGLTTGMFWGTGELFAASLQQWATGAPPRWPVNEVKSPRHRSAAPARPC